MSYNITDTKYIKGKLSILLEDARRLYTQWEEGGNLAEGNFLEEVVETELNDSVTVEIEHPWWYGEFSGSSYDNFLEALSFTKGKAHILVTWEGGDKHTVLVVTHGLVEERPAKIVAGDEE